MFSPRTSLLALGLFLVFCVGKADAFGAGNIASLAKVEGTNWRHGDIEDTLKHIMMASVAGGKKFDSMMVKRVYFGNWLRDYSQAVDVGALKYVEAGTVRLLLWLLSFMTFGYATGEFEVTRERLGTYRPEEHIDNPKDYADNEDARTYDDRLRGPVDEEVELGIDPDTGLKNYIANERLRTRDREPIATSAGLVRRLFTRSIQLARRYGQRDDKRDLYEALRLMGTGLHCLEDYAAHSNYTELALIELGEESVFPQVGVRSQVEIQGRQVYPIVTGTFGSTDFVHSVMGELTDKTVQSEVQQLETTFNDASDEASKGNEQSIIKDLMSQLNIGGDDDDIDGKTSELEEKSNAQKESRKPFGVGDNADDLIQEIYPFLEFHDQIMNKLNDAIDAINEAIGIKPLLDKLSEATSLFVYSLLAPYIVPLVNQVKTELQEGSTMIIESSEKQQHHVFDDPYDTNPTHSMLSKDHFTNRLNEPAGKMASEILKFVVPMLMAAWDDDSDTEDLMEEIIGAVFHHPAFRDGSDGRPGVEGRQRMFGVIEQWWNEKDESEKEYLRDALSADGVRDGRNHKEGHDTGHGGCKPLHRNKPKKDGGEFEGVGQQVGQQLGQQISQVIGGGDGGNSESLGGFGGMLGGLAGAALSQAFSGDKGEDEEVIQEKRYSGGGYERKEQRKQTIRDDEGGYGERTEESYTASSGYGGRRKEESYGREESYGGSGGRSGHEGREDSGYERQESYGGGGHSRQERSEYESRESSGYEREESYGGGRGDYGRQESFGGPPPGPPGGFESSYESRETYGRGGRQEFEERTERFEGGRGGFESSYRRQGGEEERSFESFPPREEGRGGYGGERGGYGGYGGERRGGGDEEDDDEERREKHHHKKKHHKHDDDDDEYYHSGDDN